MERNRYRPRYRDVFSILVVLRIIFMVPDVYAPHHFQALRIAAVELQIQGGGIQISSVPKFDSSD